MNFCPRRLGGFFIGGLSDLYSFEFFRYNLKFDQRQLGEVIDIEIAHGADLVYVVL